MKEVRVKRKKHIEELRGCGRKKIEGPSAGRFSVYISVGYMRMP